MTENVKKLAEIRRDILITEASTVTGNTVLIRQRNRQNKTDYSVYLTPEELAEIKDSLWAFGGES
jgi:hypothetical protein